LRRLVCAWITVAHAQKITPVNAHDESQKPILSIHFLSCGTEKPVP
jgi:hypothetical protein